MKYLLVVLMFLATKADAQGMSYLGLCSSSWDCRATMETWRGARSITTGWLESTFNSSCECGDKILADKRPKNIRIHLMNGPCLRNGRCGRYEPLAGYNVTKANRDIWRWSGRVVRRFEAILSRVKNRLETAKGRVACYVSPCLECDLNEAARRVLLHRVSSVLPNCLVVDNPNSRACIRGAVCERHGAHPKLTTPCIADMDGTDGRSLNGKKWLEQYKHCAIAYYWEPWMNCIRGDFTDPRQRVCKYGWSVYRYARKLLCQFYSPLSGTC